MRKWGRATHDKLCGLCGSHIAKDDPVLAIKLPQVKTVLWRCQSCSGPAPPDLPAYIHKSQRLSGFTTSHELVQAFKAKYHG